MENKLVIKEYKIDYSFIIKNYLNPEMWEKTWTLFMYKNFVFTLRLTRIKCQEQEIVFEIKLEDIKGDKGYSTDWLDYDCNYIREDVYYNLKINDIKFLKNKINSAMVNAVRNLEKRKIRGTNEYKAIKRKIDTEYNTLRQIAEDFLDENGVKNDDIREAYIGVYVDNNRCVQKELNNMLVDGEYKFFTDLYLILAELNEDKNLKETVEWRNRGKIDLAEMLRSVEEYIAELETEEKQEELKENLDSI